MPPSSELLADVERWMDRLFVAAPGARLRTEDRRKAVEVAAMLLEVRRAAERCGQRADRTEAPGLTLVDAAAGKTYVGLLAAHLALRRGTNQPGRIVAIEREAQRAAVAADAARTLAQLTEAVPVEVRVADVGDESAWPPSPDIVVGLHACGPAADVIITQAINQKARHLLLVPCCTGDAISVMEQAQATAMRLGIPRHAPVRRRCLQSFVDAARTWRLEAAGYETEVVELCAPTTTPHNLLWRARRVGEPTRQARAQAALARLLSSSEESVSRDQ
ncbi:MAG TPA: methyltransferase [Polyangia bacterium]